MRKTLVMWGLAALFTAFEMSARASESRPAGGAAATAGGAFPIDTAAVPDSSLVFRIQIGNRLFPDWKEERELHLAEPFHLGDTEYLASLRSFLPDFRLGETGAFSASRTWNNPAVRVMVYQDTAAVDSTWAFRNFPPHYSPRSFFTFKLVEIVLPSGGRGEARR